MTDQAPKELGSSELMRRTLLSGFFALIATASPAAPPPVNPADTVAFMNQLWDRAVVLLNNKTDAAIRTARFRELFRTGFRLSRNCAIRVLRGLCRFHVHGAVIEPWRRNESAW